MVANEIAIDLEAAGSWAKHYFLASRSLMEVLLRPYDLGNTQWYVLHLLATDGPIPQRDLSGTVGVERATLSGVVSALVRKGLVSQEPAPDDQRQKVLHLTASGRKLWKSLPNPITSIAHIAFDGVDPSDLATMNRVLREATERLNTHRKKAT